MTDEEIDLLVEIIYKAILKYWPEEGNEKNIV